MRRTVAALLLAAIGAVMAAGLVGGMASAAGSKDSLVIRRVDTRDAPRVEVTALATGRPPSPGSFTVRENGKAVGGLDAKPLGEAGVGIGAVLVIDTSDAMAKGGALDRAKVAAKSFVAAKGDREQVAVVAFGGGARVAANFTDDGDLLDQALDGLSAGGGSALWDGVRRGAALSTGRPDLQPNLVLLAGSPDSLSLTSADEARGSVVDSKATAFVLGLKGRGVEEGAVRRLADATGGTLEVADEAGALGPLYTNAQRTLLQGQVLLRWTARSKGTLDIDVRSGRLQATAPAVAPDTVRDGALSQPDVAPRPVGPGILTAGSGKWVVALLVLGAAGLGAYGLILLAFRETPTLQSALRPYADEPGEEGEDEAGTGMAQMALTRRAVALTARFARERGVLDRIETALEKADLPLRPAESLFFYLVGVALFTLLGLVLWGFFGGVVTLLVGGLVPIAALRFKGSMRHRKFTSQLPDTLQLLSGSLRAGYSLLQGVEAVSQEVDDPMGQELRRVLVEARLGRPLETSLDECAERMESLDFSWAVMAVRIQREVGGNLAELLSTVAETMVARERLRREVRALTAEGRMSAIVLGILPLGLAAVMYVVNPTYIQTLFGDSLGQVMLVGSAMLAIGGFLWMKKMIEIEV